MGPRVTEDTLALRRGDARHGGREFTTLVSGEAADRATIEVVPVSQLEQAERERDEARENEAHAERAYEQMAAIAERNKAAGDRLRAALERLEGALKTIRSQAASSRHWTIDKHRVIEQVDGALNSPEAAAVLDSGERPTDG